MIKDKNSYLEIGGGFGVNVHLLLTNYENIRKVVYLDIPPNLYTGTQYLKAFFGSTVKDYRQTRHLRKISFNNNDELEIFAIAPWQLENLELDVDILWNSHSFVEMPVEIIKNYANIIENMKKYKDTSIVLISYDGFDPKTTIDPEILPDIFAVKNFEKFVFPSLLDKTSNNIYYIAK